MDVPRWDGETAPLPDARLLRDSVRLPELSQGELVRYYTELSARNYGIDSGTYPLGSCTMKYNPKVDDLVASLPGLADAHPQARAEDVQGTLRTLAELSRGLGEITGLGSVGLAPAAGAQGELAGVLMITRALEDRGELAQRRRILVPDSAHGTNPATAAMAGFTVTQIPTAADGSLDRATIEGELDGTVAAVMVTVPNTLGLWEQGIEEVAGLIHEAGAYLYGDGANLNAIMGRVRYGDLGFDVVHLNLHKSFSTPHGGGGPGAGPVCCGEELAPYLPAPVVVECDDGLFRLVEPERSIGRLQQFHGNVGVLIRAYAYMRALGLDGLRAVSGQAVLNANYLRVLLDGHYDLPYDRPVLHEVVFSGTRQRRDHGVRHLRHRQAPHRPRLPPAHRLLPPDRRGSADDRADRDGAPRGRRSLGRRHDRHRRRGRARPGDAARRPVDRPHRTPRRGHRGTTSRAPLAAPPPQTAERWWAGEDSNLRRRRRQVYSLLPLSARAPTPAGGHDSGGHRKQDPPPAAGPGWYCRRMSAAVLEMPSDVRTRLIRVALGDEPADAVVRGARVVNVFTREVVTADVVCGGRAHRRRRR